MGIKLTFKKSFDMPNAAGYGRASLEVITADGDTVEGVRSVSVEQGLDGFPIMHIEVVVLETFAENAAARLKK